MNMLQTVKKLSLMTLLLSVLPMAWGYALLGPLANGDDNWQTRNIGYGLPYAESFAPGGPVELGDIGGPKDFQEFYRRSVPVLYYAADGSWWTYFKSNGMAEVDKAFAIVNNAMTNSPTGATNGVDGYSATLSEFPPETAHINFTAQSLYLTDLKSITLHCILEQLGLAEPERFTWTLAERTVVSPPGCPLGTLYFVVQRNFRVAPPLNTETVYSPYVNDTLYSYFIAEACRGTPTAITVPFHVDPFADEFTAVAANNFDGLNIGAFYTGLTRDDVGGLRYLLSSNNVVFEDPPTGSLLQLTNVGGIEVITSSNFNSLFVFSQTNNPALIPVVFNGVQATEISHDFTVIAQPNVVAYFTNFVGEPTGTPPHLVVKTNDFTYIPVEVFVDSFDNILTNGNLTNTPNVVLANNNIHLTYSTNTPVFLQTVSLKAQPGQPVGSPPITNTTLTPFLMTNVPSGEYLTIPAGQCGWRILSILATNVLTDTNVIASATNIDGFVGSQSIVSRFTNHIFRVQPITCSNVVDTPRIREGVGRVQFVRADFDGVIGQAWRPVTNIYVANTINGSGQVETLRYVRVAVQPDILLSTEDFVAPNTFNGTVERSNPNFDQGLVVPTQNAGPGVFNSPSTIWYNTIGKGFENGLIFAGFTTNVLATELSHVPELQWATFDASTNLPTLYPSGSAQDLINQVLVRVTPPPPTLPDAFNSLPYTPITFTATGGPFAQPFTWTATGLPTGMSITPDGTLSGTATLSGTYNVTVTMTDALGRSVSWGYSLVVQ